MIRLEEVSLSLGNRLILQDINLTVETGETMVIIGPSGSGKSTLLRLMIGLLKPTQGKIYIDNCEISTLNETQLNQVRLRMGMVFQYSALFDFLTVGENVAFGLREHGQKSEADIAKVVRRCLRMVGLWGRENDWPNELSGGMKKRVSLARAIATEPQILLYDEPSAGLDPIMSSTIDRLIVSTQRRMRVTSLVVTHHMDSAFAIADRMAMIHEGRILQVGKPEEFKNSQNPLIERFIYGAKQRDLMKRRNDL
ncbi:MAG: ABC transporter ATP-binding protein [Sporomusaceae bacterium]|nr:ABC transporter ATP-binding protein [Sporomusaceae bacterium]